jgi:hypothetical protein
MVPGLIKLSLCVKGKWPLALLSSGMTPCILAAMYQTVRQTFCLHLILWRQRQYVPLKYWFLSTELLGVIPEDHKISTHHCEDLKSHLQALFVLTLARVLLTGSCWADRVQTAACQTECPYSRIESWTASFCVSLPVVPLWIWQSGLHFHTWTW